MSIFNRRPYELRRKYEDRIFMYIFAAFICGTAFIVGAATLYFHLYPVSTANVHEGTTRYHAAKIEEGL